MPETRQPVQTFLVHYQCDDCHIGEMMDLGVDDPSGPIQFLHKCSHCGRERGFLLSYPRYQSIPLDQIDPPTPSPLIPEPS